MSRLDPITYTCYAEMRAGNPTGVLFMDVAAIGRAGSQKSGIPELALPSWFPLRVFIGDSMSIRD